MIVGLRTLGKMVAARSCSAGVFSRYGRAAHGSRAGVGVGWPYAGGFLDERRGVGLDAHRQLRDVVSRFE